MVCTSRATIGHTDSAEAAPAPFEETSASTSAATTSMPVTPWRGPEGDPAVVRSSELVDWMAKATQQPRPSLSLRRRSLPQPPCRTSCPQDLSPPRAPPSRPRPPLSSLCPSPEQSSQLYVPFDILSQREIGPNPFHTKMPDHL